jgi:lipopolysaccharide export system ATP-binding protein
VNATEPSPGHHVTGQLEAHHLQKYYGKREVVKDVSLAVRTGEVVGLLGPNGAGKTTSFYMLVGLLRASAGDITIDGQSIEHMPIHRRARLGLGYLPQETSIFRKLNVQDNVRAVLELQRDDAGVPLTPAEIERRLTDLLQELRVEHLRESPSPALSGGGNCTGLGNPPAFYSLGRAVCRY